ncbi:branched-chain amino acid aminotransferase [Actinokineospora guangxiensis]|uniref:Branched-chain-amino-acid aminotransferase n=1 Tax=Actinokineospora guangxiensis TaxID=1490288 RepID=A0ABW0EVG1_9PSEU
MSSEPARRSRGAVLQDVLPESLGFGTIFAPLVVTAWYRRGRWEDPVLCELGPVASSIGAKALQYGQSVFEGMKAYRDLGERSPESGSFLFRPHDHARRFARSARRLGMPELPPEVFVSTVVDLVAALDEYVPGRRGQSLYLRPTMVGTTEDLTVRPATEFCYTVLATPSDALFTEPINVWVERGYSRAGAGGTGNVKAAGNYAASFAVSERLLERGFHQPLWLDAATRGTVEEFTAMNVFVRRGEQLLTPPLSDTILAGVTRDSVMRLVEDAGDLQVREEAIPIDGLLAAIERGEDIEVFGTGTAAVVAPVALVGDESGLRLHLRGHETAARLREQLLDVQHGVATTHDEWLLSVGRS